MKMEHIRGDRKGFFRAVDGSVEAGLISYEYARANSRKVIPLCSFARAVFDKMLGIRDVLVR